MAEYIEREALIAWIEKQKRLSKLLVIMAVEETPAADVEPVKRGEWNLIKRKNMWGDIVTVCECSSCRKSDINGKGIMWKYNYCPNCGAKMKG